MKEKDEDLNRWIKEAFDEAPPSASFTDKVMNIISETPELDVRPLISRRIWKALLFILAGLFTLVILAAMDLRTSIQLPLNPPDISSFFMENWLAFGGLLLTTLLIIADEIWRRKRKGSQAFS